MDLDNNCKKTSLAALLIAGIVYAVRFLSWFAGKIYIRYVRNKDNNQKENLTGLDYSVDMDDSETVDITDEEINERIKKE